MSSPDDFADVSAPSSSPDTSNDTSPSPPSSSSPLILYSPPTIWGLLRGAAINLFLPFLNGLMLGFGELLAHETAFRLGWAQTRVSLCISIHGLATTIADVVIFFQVFPTHRSGAGSSHSMGPGIEVRDDPIKRRRMDGEELDMYTSLE